MSQDETAARAGKCMDCGAALNDGESKTFTVCDSCWDEAYSDGHRTPLSIAEAALKDQREVLQQSTDRENELRVEVDALRAERLALDAVAEAARHIHQWDEGGRADSSELDLCLNVLGHRLIALDRARSGK